MQLLDTPRRGKLGVNVFYTDAVSERVFARTRAIPTDPGTPEQTRLRALMAYFSGFWGLKLSEEQRQQWIAASLNAPTKPWLGRYGHLSGQQLEVKINMTLQVIGKPPVFEPPEPVAFSPNPVTALEAVQDPEAGVRLLLNAGTLTEDIMVFGQPPCSRGRMKHRRLYYLGLVGLVTNGQADITDLYTAKFGAPAPGQKVFIGTCQTKNGWKAQDHVFSAIISPPTPPAKQQVSAETPLTTAAAPEPPKPQAALPPGASPLPRAVYKGSTPDALGEHTGLKHVQPMSTPWAPLVHSLWTAIGRLGWLGVAGVGD